MCIFLRGFSKALNSSGITRLEICSNIVGIESANRMFLFPLLIYFSSKCLAQSLFCLSISIILGSKSFLAQASNQSLALKNHKLKTNNMKAEINKNKIGTSDSFLKRFKRCVSALRGKHIQFFEYKLRVKKIAPRHLGKLM